MLVAMELSRPRRSTSARGRGDPPAHGLGRGEPDLTALRTRRGLAFVGLMCLTGFPLDVALAQAELAPWQPAVAIRLITAVLAFAVLGLIAVRDLQGRALLRLERVTTPLFAVLMTLPALTAAGLHSLYVITPALVIIGRSAMRADPWKAALPSVALSVGAAPAVLLAGALFSDGLATQWTDVIALTTLFIYMMILVSVAAVVLWNGHTTYSLQHQLYEARQIGRYKLRTLLGSGGMGEVWSADFPALKRDVAVKILRLPDQQAIARFEREVRATSELTHPNTIRVFDYGRTDDGLWYYAMEKLEGESLAELIRREAPLPPARALHLLLQASRALAEAHARGIIHRDLKPENLFIAIQGGERDFLKVLDFGIAKTAGPADGIELQTTGAIQGTPGYIAPEILRGHRADARADIYGLGACGYVMLTGRPPFTGETLAAILESTLAGDLDRPSDVIGRELPSDVEAVVMRCLASDPDHRHASASELSEALASCELAGSWAPKQELDWLQIRPTPPAIGQDETLASGALDPLAPTLAPSPTGTMRSERG